MSYVDDHPDSGVIYTEGGFLLQQQPPTVRGPDVAFVRAARVARGQRGFFVGAPDLAIEVVSSPNRPGALLQKVAEFLDAGASCVWLIDPERRTAIVHEQTGAVCVVHEGASLSVPDMLPGFAIAVDALWHHLDQ